jgi:hypothetical protein
MSSGASYTELPYAKLHSEKGLSHTKSDNLGLACTTFTGPLYFEHCMCRCRKCSCPHRLRCAHANTYLLACLWCDTEASIPLAQLVVAFPSQKSCTRCCIAAYSALVNRGLLFRCFNPKPQANAIWDSPRDVVEAPPYGHINIKTAI